MNPINPIGIAKNTDGEFIIGDNYETIKVFDNSKKFIYKSHPHEENERLVQSCLL